MEQSEIVEAVGTTHHLPDDMVCVPFGLRCDGRVADRTSTFLSAPKLPELTPELFLRWTLLARFEVSLPLRVIGIRFGSDLDVPPNAISERSPGRISEHQCRRTARQYRLRQF
jgi:hypothetical protein